MLASVLMRPCLLVVTVAIVVAACGDNNHGQPDAGVGGAGPVEVTCATLPPSTNTCDITAGNATTLIKGTVLTPSTVYKGGQVAVDSTGHIACVGCDCAAGGETTISCPDAAISPGLINTHDHITFTQDLPYNDTGVRYDDRQQWRIGLDQHPKIPSDGGATADQIRWGELRFLMGGATSIVGSGGQAGLLRNLDQANNQGGLGKKAVKFDTFPLDDTSGGRRTTDCNYGSMPTTAAELGAFDSYEPHTSEGIDATAHNEFLCQSSTTYDTITPGVSQNLVLAKTAMIHAIGLTPADYGAMGAAGTGLIWSPRSNLTLYGETARVTTAARLGVEIALGTDWMPTGSMSLLRELACADSFNATYLDHYFTDDQLWKMVTVTAAKLTATDDLIGLLAPGKVADISIFASHGKPAFRSVIEAKPEDVALVMRGGTVLYGDDAVVGALAQTCDTVDVCGTAKRVCTMTEVGKTYSALKTAAGASTYPAFACGAPVNEPSCVPKRPLAVAGSSIYTGVVSATDADGDGIPDATDNCPRTFNPIRPLDNGVQGDADSDGKGDACDPCPLDANTTVCTMIDLTDRDHDGVPNTTDNCPETPNKDQADDDHDGKGNACDACPMEANAGGAGCPKTIYQVKDGTAALGSFVRLTSVLVTGRGTNGFFVQVKEGDPGYVGADNSGLFVFTSAAPPAAAAVGARVTIDGAPSDFHGEIQFATAATGVQVVAPGPEAAPAPIAATYAEVKTGGSRAAALEGVIVSLGAAVVTAVDSGSGEITLTDSASNTLSLDHFVFTLPTPPALNQGYAAVTGILALRQPVPAPAMSSSLSKIEPRDGGDLTLGAPGILSFSPALSFARVGVTTDLPTFPQPLTITLTSPAQGPTTVVLVSGDMNALTVANVTIPDGATSAVVPVTAIAQAADVTITATLGVQIVTAHVSVLDAVAVPATVTLSPATSVIPAHGSVQLTATLDLPALATTTVALSLTPATAGTLPATVDVAAGASSVTFTYTDTSGTAATITASYLASTSTASVLIRTGLDHLVISQVYGGGGNTNAPLTNDFIELHNPTVAAVPLLGLSVQYASSAGTSWTNFTVLPDIMVPPGGYVLVQEVAGAGGAGVALPAPDATGTIALSGTAGKVALVSGVTPLTGACPTANVIDFVGYGTMTATNPCFEGSGSTPAPSNTTAVLRAQNGCADTNDNKNDFTAGPPNPRNSAAANISICP
jgi:cytosine/adenosine deaminase-related metal-dependent hydrolase